jgi:glyoxylase-like metal-dependent hydrolase (beta-lactamase superfamily II)
MAVMPESPFFTLETIAEGVYVAFAREGTGAGSNAGIVDLGDATLVFDTFLTPAAGRSLREAAEVLTGRAPAYVVNSHMHTDHVLGNQVFADAAIIATQGTRSLLADRWESQSQQVAGQLNEAIREMEERLAREDDPVARRGIAEELGNNRALLKSLPEIRLTLPTLTFEDRLTIHGQRRQAQVISYGGGHTGSDAFLYLPAGGIAFVGDLVLVRNHLWMGHGHPEAWLGILDRLAELPLQHIVPGHGPVGTPADIRAARQYITDMLHLVGELAKAGTPAEQPVPVPAAYADWDAREVFGWNTFALRQKAGEA